MQTISFNRVKSTNKKRDVAIHESGSTAPDEPRGVARELSDTRQPRIARW